MVFWKGQILWNGNYNGAHEKIIMEMCERYDDHLVKKLGETAQEINYLFVEMPEYSSQHIVNRDVVEIMREVGIQGYSESKIKGMR